MYIAIFWFFIKAVDLAITKVGMSHGLKEANPLAVELFSSLNNFWILSILFLSSILLYFVYEEFKRVKKMRDILWIFVFANCFIVIHNIILLFSLGS